MRIIRATSRAKRAALLKLRDRLPDHQASRAVRHQPRETRGPIETNMLATISVEYPGDATSRAKRAALLKHVENSPLPGLVESPPAARNARPY